MSKTESELMTVELRNLTLQEKHNLTILNGRSIQSIQFSKASWIKIYFIYLTYLFSELHKFRKWKIEYLHTTTL